MWIVERISHGLQPLAPYTITPISPIVSLFLGAIRDFINFINPWKTASLSHRNVQPPIQIPETTFFPLDLGRSSESIRKMLDTYYPNTQFFPSKDLYQYLTYTFLIHRNQVEMGIYWTNRPGEGLSSHLALFVYDDVIFNRVNERKCPWSEKLLTDTRPSTLEERKRYYGLIDLGEPPVRLTEYSEFSGWDKITPFLPPTDNRPRNWLQLLTTKCFNRFTKKLHSPTPDDIPIPESLLQFVSAFENEISQMTCYLTIISSLMDDTIAIYAPREKDRLALYAKAIELKYHYSEGCVYYHVTARDIPMADWGEMDGWGEA